MCIRDRLCTALSVAFSLIAADIPAITGKPSSDAEKPIRWVEFNIPYDVLKKAMDIDIETYDEPDVYKRQPFDCFLIRVHPSFVS